jgi:peptidoglycan L-alanyl-D-glutamate endopeptidase CwlK
VIEQNRKAFDLLGITQYHEAGMLGQGEKIDIVLDNVNESGHGIKVMSLCEEIAPLAPVKYLPRLDMKKSVDWIFANKDKIASIICSWGITGIIPDFLRLEALDIPIFTSSGNSGKEKMRFPANLPWVFSVGAWDINKERVEIYSTYGKELDCVIPDNIYWISGKGKPMTDDGTSFCAPVVPRMLRLTGRNYTRQQAYDFIIANRKDVLEPGWDIKSGHGLFVLPKLEVPKVRDINLLHPELKVKAEKLIEIAKGRGINIIITQTWRTKEEQDALYAQGRTTPGNIVTNVKYPNSLHCWGVAFDVAVMLNGEVSWTAAHYDQVGILGESLGLEWGGRWSSFPDKPHFQLPGYKVSDLINKYGTPENFKKSWTTKKEVKDMPGFEGPAKVVFRGKELSAGILEGKTFVELRALAELLGLKVYWDNATKTVTLS